MQHGTSEGRNRAGRRRGGVIFKVVIALVVLVGLGAGALALANAGESTDGPGKGGAGTLEVHTVAKTSFDITTTSSGELEAKNSTEIRNKLEAGQATIVEIVDEGKFVKKGDMLLRLNDEEIKTKINEAESQLESAKAEEIAAKENLEIQVSQNESALAAASLKLDIARLDLDQWLQGEVKQKRQDNALAIERGEREEKRTKEKWEQSIALEKQGFLSKDQLQQDEISYLQAKADLDKARLAHTVYEEYQYPKDEKTKRSAVEEATAELERVKKKNRSELASKEASLENRKRQSALREEQLNKLKTQLAACTITAPKDGLVVYGSTAELSRNGWFRGEGPFGIGSQVYPNQLLLVLPDTSEMVATVKVHESLAGRVKEGLPATVKVEALGGKAFTGAVQSISVLAEQSGRWMDPNLREYSVKISLGGVEGSGLKPSMRCEAELRLGRVDDAMAVPVQAVFNEGALRYCYVPSGSASSKYVKRAVKIGRRSDRFVEIATGLDAGDRVLLRQPTAGEVIDRKWSTEELAAVGLIMNDRGMIEPAGSPGGGPGMGPGGAPPTTVAGGATPGAGAKPRGPGGGRGKPDGGKPVAAKPEGEAKPETPKTDGQTPAVTEVAASDPAPAAGDAAAEGEKKTDPPVAPPATQPSGTASKSAGR